MFGTQGSPRAGDGLHETSGPSGLEPWEEVSRDRKQTIKEVQMAQGMGEENTAPTFKGSVIKETSGKEASTGQKSGDGSIRETRGGVFLQKWGMGNITNFCQDGQ